MVVAAVIGFLGLLLRQPLVVSFIFVGLLVGPSMLDMVHSQDKIQLLSQLGIVVLLFLVGIKLDVQLIRSIGGVSVMTGLGQVIFTSFFGFIIGLLCGFDSITSLYIAIALTFSSTIIIVKLLSDKREIDSLHGQIALGFLIVQDLVVVVALVALATIGVGAGKSEGESSILHVALAGIGLVAFVMLFIRYIATPLTTRLAAVPELLLIFSVALAALFAAVGQTVGLGKEIGGLLAGVALASTPYRDSIAARLAPLRDFLLLFFFIALGATLDLSQLGSNIGSAVIFSLFVLIGNPLIVLAIMGLMGYRKRTGFLAGLTVAQISEFSLIFIAMGISIGHLQQDALGLVTMVGIVTIALSTYMITYSHQLYERFEAWLTPFERKYPYRETHTASHAGKPPEVVVFGLGQIGLSIAKKLAANNTPVLGVDFNPSVVQKDSDDNPLSRVYGDATDEEFVSELPLRHARWVVITIPHYHAGIHPDAHIKTLLHSLKKLGYSGKIAAVSRHQRETDMMQHLGLDLVLEPIEDASIKISELLAQR